MSVKYFVDLDGVLADWLMPALAVMGYEPSTVLDVWKHKTPRPWSVFDVVSGTANDGWRRIDAAGAAFWAGLPKLPHANRLLQECAELGETTILTSPSKHPSSYAGKVQWLDRHFGEGYARSHALLGARKHVVARPGAVLIDDSPAHCEAWEAEGGRAILFPAYGNNLYMHREQALRYVLPQLKGPSTWPLDSSR